VAALTLVLIGRLPAAGGRLGLDVKLTTTPTGELAVAPVGRVAAAESLLPGEGELRGRVTLQSVVAKPLVVRVRQLPSLGDADRALQVRVLVDGQTLYDGPAGGLRRATRASVRLRPRATALLDVRAWLPADAGGGWSGRNVTLPLEYVTSIDGKVRR
jgi:hypothetical protein